MDRQKMSVELLSGEKEYNRKMNRKNKLIENVLILLTILSIVYMVSIYLWAAAYTPLAGDDFSHGVDFGLHKAFLPIHVIGSLVFSGARYFNLQGTFFSMFLQALLSPINGFGLPQLRIVMLINVLLIMGAILFLIYELCQNIPMHKNLFISIIGAVSLFALFSAETYYEVFFWYSGSTSYGYPFSVMLLGITYMLRYYRTREIKYSKCSMILGFLACGGTLMIAGAGCYLVLLIFLYYSIKEKKFDANGRRIQILWIVGALINTCAPGNYARKSSSDQELQLVASLKNSVLICFANYKQLFKFGFIFEIIIACFIIGIIIRLVNNDKNDKSFNVMLCLFSVIAPVASWFACFPATLGYSAWGGLNNRCDFALNSTFIIPLIFACIVWGYELAGMIRKFNYAAIALLMFLMVAVNYILPNDVSRNKYFDISRQLYNGELEQYYNTCNEFYDKLAGFPEGADVTYKMNDMPHPIENTTNIYYYEEPSNPENWMNSALARYYKLNSFRIVE